MELVQAAVIDALERRSDVVSYLGVAYAGSHAKHRHL